MGKPFAWVLALIMAASSVSAQSTRPPGIPGEMPPLTVGEETSKTDVLVTGFRVSGDFDDNALNDNRNKQSNLVTVLEPELGWKLSRSRVEWNLSYRPGFARSYPLQTYNSRSQLLDTAMRFRLSRRFELRVRNSFLESKNPFDRLRQPDLTGFGVLDRPNDSILLPATRRTSEQAGLDLTYALGPHSVAGASASFFSVKYGTTMGNSQRQFFENTTSRSGHAYYSHHWTRRTWIGLDYNVQNLVFDNSQSGALIQSLSYMHTLALAPNMRVSLFAGPEHSNTRTTFPVVSILRGSEAASRSGWGWAGGAKYEWAGPHTSLTANVFRKMSDGGGVLGAVKLSSVTLEFRRQLTRRWTAELMASYEHNQALTRSRRALSYASASGGVTRMLGQNFSLDFRYWRVRQTGSGALAGADSADHNRVSTSLAYDFKFPLGR